MNPRLLLVSTELPSFGGSSTASYALFRRMLEDGHDAHYVILARRDEMPYFRWMFGDEIGNPARLPNVHLCWVSEALHRAERGFAEVVDAVAPDVAVGFGFQATVRLGAAAPRQRTAFVTGTCRQAQDYVTSGRVKDASSLMEALAARRRPPGLVNPEERRAVDACTLVVTHSPMTLQFMERFFPAAIEKIYPSPISFAEWICEDAWRGRHHARPFEQRDIDVLFIASRWNRHEKNYAMVEELATRLETASVHVVGDVPRPIRAATHHGFIAGRDELFALMGRAQVVVCPSRIDAAPGVLFEAATLGCNVVASRNCGNWELCHHELVAEPYGVEAFMNCIGRARARKHADHLERFREGGAYRELVAMLTALAQPFETHAMP